MEKLNESYGMQQVTIDTEKTETKHKQNLRSTSAQLLATLAQNWLLLDIGLTFGVPPLVLGALHLNTGSGLSLNSSETSWLGSLPSICHLIGSLASGLFQEQFGRKGSMVLVNIPFLCSWLLLYHAESVLALYIAFITMGLCAGFCEAPLHSYCGEIAEPRLRGTLSTLCVAATILGAVFMYLLGYFFEWRMAALISSGVPVITFLLTTQIPESPTFLLMRGKTEEARKALCWLRGWADPDEVKEEFQALINYTKQRVASLESSGGNKNAGLKFKKPNDLKAQFSELTSDRILIPFRLEFFVTLNASITSFIGFQPYQIIVYKELGYPNLGKEILIAGAVLVFLSSMGSLFFIRRFGKRKIALFSFGLSTMSILALGTYSSFRDDLLWIPGLYWAPLALILLMRFTLGFSIMPLPFQLLSEIFPPVGRGTASGISTAWAYLLTFSLTKTFLVMVAWLNLGNVFYLYGACGVLGWVYFYFSLPETEGKSLEQIESYFTKNHDRKEKFSVGKSGHLK
nr:PREDICTED: facilitated trehalose transporter Tret1-like [Bemisia tabaci]